MSLVEQTPEGQYHGDAAHGHRGLELTVDTGFVVRGRLGCDNARRFQRALCPGQRFGVANHKSEMVKRPTKPDIAPTAKDFREGPAWNRRTSCGTCLAKDCSPRRTTWTTAKFPTFEWMLYQERAKLGQGRVVYQFSRRPAPLPG